MGTQQVKTEGCESSHRVNHLRTIYKPFSYLFNQVEVDDVYGYLLWDKEEDSHKDELVVRKSYGTD